jgi:hypothetical protein
MRTARRTTIPLADLRRARRCALAVGAVAIAAFAPSGAVAQPADHVKASASAEEPASQAITFSNPLRRSRGPGAGMGLL